MTTELFVLEPVLFVVVAGLAVLVIDWFAPRAPAAVPAGVVAVGLVAGAIAALRQWALLAPGQAIPAFTRALPDAASHLAVAEVALLRLDAFAVFVAAMTAVFALLCVLAAVEYVERRGMARAEYFSLIAFAAAAMMLIGYAADLIIIFLLIETFSIALYSLCAFIGGSRFGQEAALKYFVLGAFAAAFLLYGITLVYGAAGVTDLIAIDAAITGMAAPVSLRVGLALVLVGLGFKIAIIPFHQWTPDVYDGAPLSVTAFMAAGTKAAAFAATLRVLWVAFGHQTELWLPALAGAAAITMIGGNLIALVQSDLKRMLGYSAVAQAGYLLVAAISGRADGPTAVLYYLVVYGLATLGAFGVLIAIGEVSVREGEDRGVDATRLDDLRGLGRRHPWLAGALALFLISLTGLPPTAGFLGKWYIFRAATGAGLTWLAIILVLTSAMSAFYYLRPLALMYMVDPEDDRSITAPAGASVAIGVAATVIALGLVLSSPLLEGAARAGRAVVPEVITLSGEPGG